MHRSLLVQSARLFLLSCSTWPVLLAVQRVFWCPSRLLARVTIVNYLLSVTMLKQVGRLTLHISQTRYSYKRKYLNLLY